MIPVVYPHGLNWFYRLQAELIAQDLTRIGTRADAVRSDKPGRLAAYEPDTVLIVSMAESLAGAERSGMAADFIAAVGRFGRRVLLNFDSVHSPWFSRHFTEAGTVTEVFDIGLYRQVAGDVVAGVPYRFVPEAFAASEAARVQPWSEGRPLPWVVLGHATRDRAALIEAILQSFPHHGFVFSPPLRPFTDRSGLDRDAIRRVLAGADLYVWGSHHTHPYHETQRALHAVAAGSIPAKIDPLHAGKMDVPWAYSCLDALVAAIEAKGLEILYRDARTWLERQGTLGGNVLEALGRGRTSMAPLLSRPGLVMAGGGR